MKQCHHQLLPEALYRRIRASVETAPASTNSSRTRILAALGAAPLLAAAVLLAASEIVYQRQRVGLEVGMQSGAQLLVMLSLLVGLRLVDAVETMPPTPDELEMLRDAVDPEGVFLR